MKKLFTILLVIAFALCATGLAEGAPAYIDANAA